MRAWGDKHGEIAPEECTDEILICGKINRAVLEFFLFAVYRLSNNVFFLDF